MRSLVFIALLFPSLAAGGEFGAFLDHYCLDCHDSDSKKGGLDLSSFTSEEAVMEDRGIWRAVFEKIESHQMPPPKREAQPTAKEREDLMAWIMDIASRPDPALGAPDPGKPALRRLTRLEYNNTIRDLFDLDLDVFIFPERLPLGDKSYFQPATGRMGDAVKVPLREYGGRYQVLCRQLGLPGDHRAEHGFRNRGDAMDFSPLLLEKYLAAASEIVNSPELPARSARFATLLGLDPAKVTLPSGKPFSPGLGETTTIPLVAEFAPSIESLNSPSGSLADFRREIGEAFALGNGGVFDAPRTLSNHTVAGKGGLIKGAFGGRTLTINPNADLWLAGFATAEAASSPLLLTNKEKGAKVFELTLDITGNDSSEGVERLGLCVLGRNRQSGEVRLAAVFSDATESSATAHIAEGAAGTTFFSFTSPAGESIRKLIVDGSDFTGDYVLLDDIGIVTNGRGRPVPEPTPPPDAAAAQPESVPAKPRAAPRDRLAGFMERAFRRPVSDEEVARFFALFEEARARKQPEDEAMRHALSAVLASPAFLFVEADGTPGGAKVSALEGTELATRLALFLWSSTPDDELISLAKAGRLGEANVLEAQTRRMLRDVKSRELSESFATQWLRLDQLHTAKPDRDLFKSFYAGAQGKTTLHGPMLVEALLLFETVLIEDRAILDFLHADYTWLNPSLARHYGLSLGEEAAPPAAAPGTTRELKKEDGNDSQWHRVPLADGARGGFITMAGPMTITSLPFRTSPVKRGAWLLETIFNRPPTEPKVAFAIENDTREAAQSTSIRQKFEAHRDQAACFSCHIRLDPPGFALERFDPVGQWRDIDGGVAVDSKGEWNGVSFQGPGGFKSVLADHPREFTRGFIEHLLSYGINRPLEIYDMPAVRKIEQAAEADGWKLSRVIVEIAKSYPFTHTRRLP